MGYTSKNGSHLEKWLAPRKMGHTRKREWHLENNSYLLKQVTLKKMGHTWKSTGLPRQVDKNNSDLALTRDIQCEYINILTWLQGFQVKPLYLVLLSLYLSLFWELRDKGNLKNLQFWPESLGAMLEYWYIERGLFNPLIDSSWNLRWDSCISKAKLVDQSQPSGSRHANCYAARRTASACRERQWHSARWGCRTSNVAKYCNMEGIRDWSW